jgi:nitrite reductase/ring-hydroxylating ferredoxin subunit
VPEIGSYVAREAAGIPLVVVRCSDGQVRAFRNACRHRGMQVASGTGCTRAFVCRYHGWTYNLEGRLRHIPHEAGFPGFDKDAHPLVPVTASGAPRPGVRDPGRAGAGRRFARVARAADRAGPATVRNRRARLRASTGRSSSRASSRAITSSRRIPESFLPYGFDNLNVIDLFGRNSRVTYPFSASGSSPRCRLAERRVEGC